MGADAGRGVSDLERPRHKVALRGFFIDRTEVTNRSYGAFCAATGRAIPSHWTKRDRDSSGAIVKTYAPAIADHPVCLVSWKDAKAYAEWARKRLPTEAEWEKAARGDDGRTFPWGESSQVKVRVLVEPDEAYPTAHAGSHPQDKSPYGVLDMAGNVSEWVEDLLAAYPGAPPATSAPSGRRVIRGGCWRWPLLNGRCSARDGGTEGYTSAEVGFRCALDVIDPLARELRDPR
jgi:serine/threonine-protein kinase